ncbi:kinase-like protein [Amniculicola lignicola CBS 123094]|uniref:Kinase-like protein n=1 Tax=Amniculicola lignicola CBS 123094 TaxID=1392246 RepID=A0A6A5WU49_9PLEO|nr:kinase-like protein [Amniculicola lignicola CBS 123094]
MLLTPEAFKQDFEALVDLGQGGDGKVSLFAHRRIEGRFVAVKFPLDSSRRRSFKNEIENLRRIGAHDNIIELLGWDKYGIPYGPQLYLDYCDIGDLLDYRDKLISAYGYVPEDTVWKLFADMSKALDHMHHTLKVPMIHGDIKADNILVKTPSGFSGQTIPVVPVFKLADFSRSSLYSPGDKNVPDSRWFGSLQYQPPLEEHEKQTPAVDIWGVGATIQGFVLSIFPLQSSEEFLEQHARRNPSVFREGQNRPERQDSCWWRYRPVLHRPLNSHRQPDIPPEPYSEPLEQWYALCLQPDARKRITASALVENVVPLAQRQMNIIQAQRVLKKHQEKLEQRKKERQLRKDTKAPTNEDAGTRPRHASPSSPRLSIHLDLDTISGLQKASSADSNELKNLKQYEAAYLDGTRGQENKGCIS